MSVFCWRSGYFRKSDAVFSVAFSFVEGTVSPLEQFLCICILGSHHGTHTDRDRRETVGRIGQLGVYLGDSVYDYLPLVIVRICDEYDELVASDSADIVVGTEIAFDCLCNLLKDLVTDFMTVVVVD